MWGRRQSRELGCGPGDFPSKNLLQIFPLLLGEGRMYLATVVISLTAPVTNLMQSNGSPEAFLIKQEVIYWYLMCKADSSTIPQHFLLSEVKQSS
jgi:hypothetical protein